MRKVIVLISGMTVLLIGIALLVLPGPALILIPAGLSILALEFKWARRWLDRVRETFAKISGWFKRNKVDASAANPPAVSARELLPPPHLPLS